MNRDIHQMENALGQHAVHRQTLALYDLMARVRDRFPEVAMRAAHRAVVG